eukprot:gnl/TRDRNA2_/TRDRNA2_149233_c0_seq1.p1 gnl/TRDRNA2_/TRDRNA2_149233_c0~~gnl/TRDRNA2_/TRDRNA2_149233_c0_seq1.p1  ORF type:complete len:367 (+),score=33.84 gnl/TRDRNA2_/TRDRNA2_149233_c0_seq1:32-1102(+)
MPIIGVPVPAVAGGRTSNAYAGALESLLAGVPRPYAASGAHGSGVDIRSLLYVTMVFGPRYNPYIPRFVSRAAALGISNLVLFCLDDEAYSLCSAQRNSRGKCIFGTPSILNKFTLPLVYLHHRIDVFWLDFDVFLMKDPTPDILNTAQAKQADILVSGSFADDCICNGLVFFRAAPVVVEWLLVMLSWMYEHTYTHDQQAFSAFLGGRPDEDNVTRPEQISSSKLFKTYLEPKLHVPRWALLDPVNEFVSAHVLNTTGWTGDLERMAIFHFLHGDSEINRGHKAHGWSTRFGIGNTSKPLLDIFYNQSDDALYSEAGPPYTRNAEIRDALLTSRRVARPSELVHCGVVQPDPNVF